MPDNSFWTQVLPGQNSTQPVSTPWSAPKVPGYTWNPNSPNGGGYTKVPDSVKPVNTNDPFNPQWTNESVPTDAAGRPLNPAFVSIADPTTGQLKQPYQMSDKLDTRGVQAIRDEALRTPGELSKWGNLAMSDQMNQNKLNQAGQFNQMKNNLAMSGGLRSGAGERMSSQALSSNLMNDQNIGMDVRKQDEASRQKWMGMLPGAELNQAQYQSGIQEKNNGNALNEVDAGRRWGQNEYNKNMDAWAAKEAAAAMPKGGGGGGGLCCFIFLEARYGNGTMDKVVRKFRDKNMTDKNRRGYYKLSEVLVPVMRKSKLAKLAVRVFMTDPMVAYGKAYYKEGSKLGFLFKPVVNFWLKTFEYLGGEHQFIRENGEVI